MAQHMLQAKNNKRKHKKHLKKNKQKKIGTGIIDYAKFHNSSFNSFKMSGSR